MHPVTLSGTLVTLRELRLDDVPDVHAIIGDDRVTRFLSFDSRSPQQAREMVTGVLERAIATPRTEFYLAITVPGDDRLVGFARLALGGVAAAKIGYAVHADHWGSGYATDAARTLITFGFTTLGLHRITAAIGPDSTASLAVAAKLGLTYEGRLRDHVFTNASWRDSLLYSTLTTDQPRA